ncbi:MAG: ATP-binding cassette domain-containing protein [Actinomycetota bacterium]|nr:ATP-binding cassette domain-containing protein [Actinomycetota bacterium]
MDNTPLLELVGIVKRFNKVSVAEGLAFSVAEGEAIGIVGPNGAGKTSLFGVISGELREDAGEIRLAGELLNKRDSADRCRMGIGRTHQIPRPFQQMTVFENVLVAAHQGAGLKGRAAADLAASVLYETGLYDVANRLAGRLGLLHRKRLEVARALATKPRILLLDEVAGGLTDPEVDELITIVLSARKSGMAVIWIEHAVRALVETVDRLICVAGGLIIGDGKPAQVLAMSEVKELFLGTEPGEEGALHLEHYTSHRKSDNLEGGQAP